MTKVLCRPIGIAMPRRRLPGARAASWVAQGSIEKMEPKRNSFTQKSGEVNGKVSMSATEDAFCFATSRFCRGISKNRAQAR
jgi:hypothetical protein